MARPVKTRLDFFTVHCKDPDDVALVRAKHGVIAKAVLECLKQRIHGGEGGYWTDWQDKKIVLFSDNERIDAKLVKAVVESCMDEDIFSRPLYDKYKILTGREVQKEWIRVVTDAKRKGCTIDPRYDIEVLFPLDKTELTPEETELPRSETELTGEENTQNRIEENRVDKIKKIHLPAVAIAPAGEKLTGKVKDEETARPFWQALVNCWFAFYATKKGEDPNFKGRNPAFFRQLYDLLQARAKKKSLAWTQEYAVGVLTKFLEAAYADKWLPDHFTLENLVKQFDPVIARMIEHHKPKEKKVGPREQYLNDLKYLLDRYREGNFIREAMDPTFYDHMVSNGDIAVGAMQQVKGETIDDKKINTVLAWLEAHKNLTE